MTGLAAPPHEYVEGQGKYSGVCVVIMPGGERCRTDQSNTIHQFLPVCVYLPPNQEKVEHPSHYGGKDDPFEHIKVAEARGWGYHVGNCTKYLWRAGVKTPDVLTDLKKARWYLDRYIKKLEREEQEPGKEDPVEEPWCKEFSSPWSVLCSRCLTPRDEHPNAPIPVDQRCRSCELAGR